MDGDRKMRMVFVPSRCPFCALFRKLTGRMCLMNLVGTRRLELLTSTVSNFLSTVTH
jgi:hypothetical protein